MKFQKCPDCPQCHCHRNHSIVNFLAMANRSDSSACEDMAMDSQGSSSGSSQPDTQKLDEDYVAKEESQIWASVTSKVSWLSSSALTKTVTTFGRGDRSDVSLLAKKESHVRANPKLKTMCSRKHFDIEFDNG